MNYADLVTSDKTFRGNVVIKIGASHYFAIRSPDSGLSIANNYNKSIASLTLNPTSIDVRRVTTTISSFTFRIVDLSQIVSALVAGDASNLIGAEVRIYLGRSGVDLDFSDYFELPLTYVQKIDHSDNSYSFSTSEQTERMAKPIYDFSSALAVDILSNTTTWTMREDITNFPSSGFLKVEDEFVSYSGKDLVNNRFTGVIRGELNSVPADHAMASACVLVQTITDNPLNIILKLLISSGGGGTYDTLQSGLAIEHTLIDITEIEALRDSLFVGVSFTLSVYSVDSALKYIETELLMPNGLRLTTSQNSKVTLALLDKAAFVEEVDVINEDTITKYPKWTLDGAKVVNSIEVQWNYSEGTKTFLNRDVYTDTASIAAYGAQTPLKYEFRGVKLASAGQALVDDFAGRMLARLSTPTPEISVTTQIDKSLQNIGGKSYLVSSKIPAPDGTLNFASDLEIISRAINQTTGDVTFKLAFTSYTTIRSGFVAPSDMILSFPTQKKVNVTLGRAAQYLVGWYMLLWDEINQMYCADAPNKIVAVIDGETGFITESGEELITESGEELIDEGGSDSDSIIFENDWATTLVNNRYRIRFANYDNAVDSEKRYAFLSLGGADFADSKPSYKVTF